MAAQSTLDVAAFQASKNRFLFSQRKNSYRQLFAIDSQKVAYESNSSNRLIGGSHLYDSLMQNATPTRVLDYSWELEQKCYNLSKEEAEVRTLLRAQKIEKLTHSGIYAIMLAHKQVRVINMIGYSALGEFFRELNVNSPIRYRLLGPKFRGLTVNQSNQNHPDTDEEAADLFYKYAHQLVTLKLDQMLKLSEPLYTMSRMKTFSVQIKNSLSAQWFINQFVPAIQWKQIECFSLKLILSLLSVESVFELLGQMTKLRKLEIKIIFKPFDNDKNYKKSLQVLLKDQAKEIKWNVEVFKIFTGSSSWISDNDFFYNLYSLVSRRTLTKVIICVPDDMPSNGNILNLKLSLKLYPKLKSVILHYGGFANILNVCGTPNRERAQQEFEKQIGTIGKLVDDCSPGSIGQGIRHLTVYGLHKLNREILRNISKVFPNLVELNIQARNAQVYESLKDKHLLEMLQMLKQLRILRFLDSYIKPNGLHHSIAFMCKRASEIRQGSNSAPMVFRIPMALIAQQNKYKSFMSNEYREYSKCIHLI